MVTVVVWRWGKKYGASHVAKMQSMLKRHLSLPHRIVCITDKPHDLPAGVIPTKMRGVVASVDHKCMRRMWIYSADAASLGERLLQIDLDVVITDSIDPIVNRTEEFVIWKSDSNYKDGWAYNPTVLLITPGSMDDIWQRYIAKPKRVIEQTEADGWGARVNTDQAVAGYLLKDREVPVWTEADGIRGFRVFAGKHGQRGEVLPDGTRIVSFHGPRDPSVEDLREKCPWIAEHWR